MDITQSAYLLVPLILNTDIDITNSKKVISIIRISDLN